MEFRFNLGEVFNQPIVEISSSLIPPGFRGDRRQLWDTVSKVTEVVNAMGEASAAAQGLTKPITTADRLRNSEHKIYLLVDHSGKGGKGVITGMLKTGKKGLYVFDRQGHHYQVQPPCVLDFYVHESRQRAGLGKQLYEHMLTQEKIEPIKMAIDRPSEKFLGFLNKHYGLNKPVKQMNNYVVFEGFFPDRPAVEKPQEGDNNNSSSLRNKVSANGLQSGNVAPYGRYGAPRPPCSMGQIIHNQSSTVQQPQEPQGAGLHIREIPKTKPKLPAPPSQPTPQYQPKLIDENLLIGEYPRQAPPSGMAVPQRSRYQIKPPPSPYSDQYEEEPQQQQQYDQQQQAQYEQYQHGQHQHGQYQHGQYQHQHVHQHAQHQHQHQHAQHPQGQQMQQAQGDQQGQEQYAQQYYQQGNYYPQEQSQPEYYQYDPNHFNMQEYQQYMATYYPEQYAQYVEQMQKAQTQAQAQGETQRPAGTRSPSKVKFQTEPSVIPNTADAQQAPEEQAHAQQLQQEQQLQAQQMQAQQLQAQQMQAQQLQAQQMQQQQQLQAQQMQKQQLQAQQMQAQQAEATQDSQQVHQVQTGQQMPQEQIQRAQQEAQMQQYEMQQAQQQQLQQQQMQQQQLQAQQIQQQQLQAQQMQQQQMEAQQMQQQQLQAQQMQQQQMEAQQMQQQQLHAQQVQAQEMAAQQKQAQQMQAQQLQAQQMQRTQQEAQAQPAQTPRQATPAQSQAQMSRSQMNQQAQPTQSRHQPLVQAPYAQWTPEQLQEYEEHEAMQQNAQSHMMQPSMQYPAGRPSTAAQKQQAPTNPAHSVPPSQRPSQQSMRNAQQTQQTAQHSQHTAQHSRQIQQQQVEQMQQAQAAQQQMYATSAYELAQPQEQRQPTMYHYWDGSTNRMQTAQRVEPAANYGQAQYGYVNAPNASGDMQPYAKSGTASRPNINAAMYQGIPNSPEPLTPSSRSLPQAQMYTGPEIASQ